MKKVGKGETPTKCDVTTSEPITLQPASYAIQSVLSISEDVVTSEVVKLPSRKSSSSSSCSFNRQMSFEEESTSLKLTLSNPGGGLNTEEDDSVSLMSISTSLSMTDPLAGTSGTQEDNAEALAMITQMLEMERLSNNKPEEPSTPNANRYSMSHKELLDILEEADEIENAHGTESSSSNSNSNCGLLAFNLNEREQLILLPMPPPGLRSKSLMESRNKSPQMAKKKVIEFADVLESSDDELEADEDAVMEECVSATIYIGAQ